MTQEEQRKRFLELLAKDEDDLQTRMAYADWLLERGEDDEALRQHQWPKAKAWLMAFCEKYNRVPEWEEFGSYYPDLNYHELLKRAREALELPEGDDDRFYIFCGANERVQDALNDNKDEFWKNWSTLTGMPLPEGLAENFYAGCSC